jgi:ubiquinol-cytochrome c reductase cytochrome b subunit
MHLLALHEHGSINIVGPTSLYMRSTSLKNKVLAFIIPNTRAVKRIGPHNEDVISLLVGGILGDATVERNLNGGVRFLFKQSILHTTYLHFLFSFLYARGYCNNSLPVLKEHIGSSNLTFYTFSFTSLLWLYKAFYTSNGIKMIPSNISELLTPLALAVWIIDDGGLHKTGLGIVTHSFTELEVNLLIKVLSEKYNLICSNKHLNNGKYIIYISAASMNQLKLLVLPHMCPSMLYKLGL